MTRSPLDRRLHALVGSPPPDARPDAELLDRFARYAERPALEAVVRRHAPLVRGVCRRHLGPGPDADDAFQATFLVLLRHAGRGRAPTAVGPWLFAVAVRTSARLRSRRKPLPLPDALPDRASAPDPAADWVPILDAELARLPGKYRDALVLCELQGRSRREAAGLLHIAEGTLSSRLSRGRELLRRRLLRHGTLLPAAGLGTLTAGEVASAEVLATTLALADGTVPAGVAAAVAPAGWGGWKWLAGGLLAAGLVGGLAVVPGDDKPAAPQVPGKPAAAKPADAPPPKSAGPAVPDREALQGVWLFDDLPVSEAGLKVLKAPAAEWATMVAEMRKFGRLVVHGERVWFLMGRSNPDPHTFALDPDRLPKWIDCQPRRLDGVRSRTKPEQGVYALTGDRLTLALGIDAPRPADLGPTDDPERVIALTFHKGPPPDPTTLAAAKPLLGRWELVRGKCNLGEKGAVEEVNKGWLEVTPDAVFFRCGLARHGADHFDGQNGPVIQAATYTLDPAKRHPWIDLQMLTDTDNKGQPVDGRRFGVYELAGDTLRLVLGTDRTFRPLDFAVQPDTTPPGDRTRPNPLQTESFEFKRAGP